MLDRNKVKQFWDARAKTYESLAFESIANLEQNEKNLHLKINHESEKVFSWLGDVRGKKILDLGAGVGQWAFRFIEKGAKSVKAIEFSEELANVGEVEANKRGVQNLQFIVSPAEEFDTDEKFDIVLCSGLCVYLNNDQFLTLVRKFPKLINPGGLLLMREGMAIADRHEINNKFSEHLQSDYSATYRTRDQYLKPLLINGLELVKDENMFEEGHILNKYKETRLHLFLIRNKTNA